jgi:hypothetical protein
MLDRQREDVDQVLASVSDEVRTDDAVRPLVDHHLRPGRPFRVGAAREPRAHVVDRNSKLEPFHLRQYRHRKYACRDARVIRRMLCALDDVPADDPTFIGRDRGKLRGFGDGVTADKHRRVRRRAQARIESDPPAFRLDLTGGKVEGVDVRDTSRSLTTRSASTVRSDPPS